MEASKKEKKKVRILSIDGGGIRGVIPAVIIEYIEGYLEEKKPGTTIADHFDFIAGTSTGGILASFYLTPKSGNKKKAKYSASQALEFYVKEGYSIFNASKLRKLLRFGGIGVFNATGYNPRRLEDLFKEKFGDLRMSDLIKPCLIPTYDMEKRSSFFFTSRETKPEREFYLRDVLRSTSAGPTTFPPAKIKNIVPNTGEGSKSVNMLNLDGGVFANNPMMCAYAEARGINFTERNNDKPSAKDMYILSIGTGGSEGFELNKEDRRSSHKWSLAKWAKWTHKIMMDGSSDTVDYQMKRIHDTLQPGDLGNYMRIDVPKIKGEYVKDYDSDMANASEENIGDLLKAGKKTLEDAKYKGLDKYLDGLLDE